VSSNPHFETAASWKAARAKLAFEPIEPTDTAGRPLRSLRVHVRDHRQRELSLGERTLEAHYGAFVLSESRNGIDEARRLALDVSYGRVVSNVSIAGHDGRVFELGPVPPPDDIDGRSPAVVVWHDGEMLFLIASSEMASAELIRIAVSLYK